MAADTKSNGDTFLRKKNKIVIIREMKLVLHVHSQPMIENFDTSYQFESAAFEAVGDFDE